MQAAKQKEQIILCVLSSIFATQIVLRSRGSGAKAVWREWCGVALNSQSPEKIPARLALARRFKQKWPGRAEYLKSLFYLRRICAIIAEVKSVKNQYGNVRILIGKEEP